MDHNSALIAARQGASVCGHTYTHYKVFGFTSGKHVEFMLFVCTDRVYVAFVMNWGRIFERNS